MPKIRHNRTLQPLPGEDHVDARGTPYPIERAANAPGHRLTSRETEVISLVSEGKSNKEIARALYISVDTVKAHLTSIMHKLGTRNRTGAVAKWLELTRERAS